MGWAAVRAFVIKVILFHGFHIFALKHQVTLFEETLSVFSFNPLRAKMNVYEQFGGEKKTNIKYLGFL